jgi:hypothetical protein
MAAYNAILEHCIDQTFHANRKHCKSEIYAVDDHIYLSTQNLTLSKGRARKLVLGAHMHQSRFQSKYIPEPILF